MKLAYSNNSIQYKVSLASFEEIDIFAVKSFLDCPANASLMFAPIEVAERRNCLERINSFFDKRILYKSMDCFAKAKALFFTILSFIIVNFQVKINKLTKNLKLITHNSKK